MKLWAVTCVIEMFDRHGQSVRQAPAFLMNRDKYPTFLEVEKACRRICNPFAEKDIIVHVAAEEF